MVEKEPNYTYVTARLLLDDIRAKALTRLGVAEKATQFEMESLYPSGPKSISAVGRGKRTGIERSP